jgi:acyl-CoA reductase-like NAD-dependent aldehyde dehydrogenase
VSTTLIAPPMAVGAALRGQWFEGDLVPFGGRTPDSRFLTPDPVRLLDALPLRSPRDLADVHRLRFEEIADYVEELGTRLDLTRNVHLQAALAATSNLSALTHPLLRAAYLELPKLFTRATAREIAERTIGIENLDGWVEHTLTDGRSVSVRAFGARTVHIIAGNSPVIAGLSILRNLLTRGDAVIKTPSNDPFTAPAIARTMIELDADHPLTRHLSVAYWKGGDERIERPLYHPRNIEKIVAWGGFASIQHVTAYLQPGLQLITLDPKRSLSIVGPDAFHSDDSLHDVARRLATDIGAINQEGCVNARVVYVVCGTDESGIERLERLAALTYAAMLSLPSTVSTHPKAGNAELTRMLTTARLNDEWYSVVGGHNGEGAIITSRLPEPVEFADRLSNRIANLVPIDEIETAIRAVNASSQTIGIYPDALMHELRDDLAIQGAQRLASLGYAASATVAGPQDAIEPTRALCRWILCEECDPKVTPGLWDA